MAFHVEGSAQILLKSGVFLNPAQVFNRDMSMLVASVFASRLSGKSLSILEPLAATGLRSIRYYKELLCPVSRLVANDIDPDAVQQIKDNFAANNVTGEVWQKDACDAMFNTKGTWDIVDVDPYGSAACFLDSAVQAVKNGGLLCVTSTDMATLCGNNPDTCFYKYQSVPTKAKHCHEFGLRILLYQLNATANKYQLAVIPLVSLSVDFYIRVFVKVINSATAAKTSIANSSYVFQCSDCPAYYINQIGRPGKKKWVGNTYNGHGLCPHCGGKFLIQGPIYSGKLHDKEFVSEMLELANTKDFKTKDKVKGVLMVAKEELDCPLSWNTGNLCKFFKTPALSQKNFRSAIKSIGKEVSQSHTRPGTYKTNAGVDDLFDIFKYWKKEKAPDRYLSNIPQDSPAFRILQKEPDSTPPDFELEFNEHEKEILNQLRYPMNEPNWGPKPRPKKQTSEEKKEEI
jgi:tRNA (guanine26-N2/guanine27-N2)-dimethyltransferase